jgi:hypothetical protein
MSEPLPKTWQEALPYVAWIGLVISCFLVFITKLIERSYGEALVSLLIGICITAIALHSKDWLARTNPNWVYVASAVVAVSLTMSPFIEEKRWPFSMWFPTPPTTDQIADAVAQKITPLAQSPPKADQIVEAITNKLDKLPTADEIANAISAKEKPVNPPGANDSQRTNLQNQLSQVAQNRDSLGVQLNAITAELNKTEAQLPQKSPLLGIDDTRRMQIIQSMSELTRDERCSASIAIGDELTGKQHYRTISPGHVDENKADILISELRSALDYSGWIFGQSSKSFFPPGVSIIVAQPSGHIRECALRLKDLLDSLGVQPVNMKVEDSPDLTACHCFEMTVGRLEKP